MDWRRVGWAVYIGLNLGLIALDGFATPTRDWAIWRGLPEAIATGTLYDQRPDQLPYVWSPLIAPPMAVVGMIGPWAWGAVQVAALALLRDWRLAALVLVSWGFWTDVAGGNLFTFVVVAGALAVRGSHGGAIASVALFLLAPRPVQAPLIIGLLWARPDLRRPAALLFALHAVAVLATGYGPDWVTGMLAHGGSTGLEYSLGPSRWLGLWWLALGIPLGMWLMWRGHVGWAGLAVTPYLLPTYLLLPLIGRLHLPQEVERRLGVDAGILGADRQGD